MADMREQVAERSARLAVGRCGVVAVAAGSGMRELYEGLGSYVVDPGETFNPSIYDLLAAIHEVPAEEVVVLPNNPNVVMAAERAAELSDKRARVVRCTAPQAGLAALVELDPESALDDNAARLTEGLEAIRAGSVAPAARDDAQGRFKRGDAVGFIDEEIVAWGGAGSTLAATMEQLAADSELLTVIGGAEAPIPLRDVEERAPQGVQFEVQEGVQPHYWWLLAAQ
jgi:dihydroxyacetone kinase-like predicted kinase